MSESIGKSMIIDPTDIHSAVPSWSGYDFQGQIAIYAVLCTLNRMEIGSEDLNQYFLEIEQLEDFAIKRNDSYLSINQVKSYQGKSYFSSYKEAVLELLGKCAKYNSIKNANIHTTCLIEELNKDEIREVIENFQPTSKVEKLTTYKDLLFKENKFDEVYEKLFFNHKNNGSPFSLVVDIDEVGGLIKEQIKIFYKKNHYYCDASSIVYLQSSEENINYAYHNLQAELDKWIIKNHKNPNKEPTINFSSFFEILTTEFVYRFSNKTAASLLKEALKKCYFEYCEDYDIAKETHPKCMNWEKNWQFIRQLSDEQFILLCKKISPDIVIKNDSLTLEDYRGLINTKGVRDALIHLTLEIGNSSLELTDVKNVFILNSSGSHYLLSTISNAQAPKAVSNVGRKIIQNLKHDNQLSHLLFDIDKIITTELKGDFPEEIYDIRRTYREEQGHTFDQRSEIILPKKLEFINVEQAKEELK